jgi:hypothetical protein
VGFLGFLWISSQKFEREFQKRWEDDGESWRELCEGCEYVNENNLGFL